MKTVRTLVFFSLCICAGQLLGQSLLDNHAFQIINRELDKTTGKYKYYGTKIHGSEIPNNALNRLAILSESQYDYPEPMSGCGPTSILNILIWYEKYGLIESENRNSNTKRYKQALFREIDNRLLQQTGKTRTELEGTSNFDAAMVLDSLVRERSNGAVRIHTDFLEMPITTAELLKTMPNYRAGYFVAYPKDPDTGKMLGLHAMTLLRADRAGYVTVGTWGEIYRGLLKKRGKEQWLVTQDGSKTIEFKVAGMMRFIPFNPK